MVQLRQENEAGTLYNLVGFQTRLKWGEQKRVFSMIPGLEHAEFARYGVMHRNTYLNGPEMLGANYALKGNPLPALCRSALRRGGLHGVHRQRPDRRHRPVLRACTASPSRISPAKRCSARWRGMSARPARIFSR